MKNVLLLDTSIGSRNQGDEIINRSIAMNWPELFDENHILRLASHTPPFGIIQTKLRKKNLLSFYNADTKFLCGTNALYTNMLRPLPNWNINYFNSGILKGTVCLGVGIGKNSKRITPYTKMLYKKVLSHNYVHSTRDDEAQRLLNEIGLPAVNTGCPTLWGLTDEHCDKIPSSKSDKVVVTLTSYLPDRQNDLIMLNILGNIYKKLYFWPQDITDLSYLQSLGYKGEVVIVAPNLSAYDRLLTEEKPDYIGNRLHGGIFALQHACRSIIISIDYRAKSMKEKYDLPYIERADIEEGLEDLILSRRPTRVAGLDFDLIDQWKQQFK